VSSLTIIGIDPGTNILGFGVISASGNNLKLVAAGSVHMSGRQSHYEKLKRVYRSIEDLLDLHKPDVVSVEAPFFGKNVQSMLKLGRAQGITLGVALSRNLEVVEYSPKKIKQAITGRGNATKEQVAAMLEQIFDRSLENIVLDATDGLAAAVCHYYQGHRPTGGGKKYASWEQYVNGNPARVAHK
jgi:crossover junction endodeoxyribonuclease RuvC